MKRLPCILFLLLVLSVPAFAESIDLVIDPYNILYPDNMLIDVSDHFVIPNSLIEHLKESDLDALQRVDAVLSESDFDFSHATYHEDINLIVIDVAIDGLKAELGKRIALDRDESDPTWSKVRESAEDYCQTIVFNVLDRPARIVLNIVNDSLYVHGSHDPIMPINFLTVYMIGTEYDVMRLGFGPYR